LQQGHHARVIDTQGGDALLIDEPWFQGYRIKVLSIADTPT
jgi:hypothetical protein